jgi:hypothetical protein
MIAQDHVDGCHLRHLGQPPREEFDVFRRDSCHFRVEDITTDEDVVNLLCLTIFDESLEDISVLVVAGQSADVNVGSVGNTH